MLIVYNVKGVVYTILKQLQVRYIAMKLTPSHNMISYSYLSKILGRFLQERINEDTTALAYKLLLLLYILQNIGKTNIWHVPKY